MFATLRRTAVNTARSATARFPAVGSQRALLSTATVASQRGAPKTGRVLLGLAVGTTLAYAFSTSGSDVVSTSAATGLDPKAFVPLTLAKVRHKRISIESPLHQTKNGESDTINKIGNDYSTIRHMATHTTTF